MHWKIAVKFLFVVLSLAVPTYSEVSLNDISVGATYRMTLITGDVLEGMVESKTDTSLLLDCKEGAYTFAVTLISVCQLLTPIGPKTAAVQPGSASGTVDPAAINFENAKQKQVDENLQSKTKSGAEITITLSILKSGVEEWNSWREKNPTIIPDLKGADLRGLKLVEANFSKANLQGANFEGSDLRVADFSKANLREADFGVNGIRLINSMSSPSMQFDITGVNLSGAIFIGANLTLANLELANLSGADFKGAILRGANLENANLDGANFEGAKGYKQPK
jgi:uncharacterized protein YjbI with pentapeptide repeats